MADEPGPMIYVVDDDDAVRDSLKILLQSYGFDVAGFASVPELLQGGNADEGTGRPACIVLDLHLPGTSGLDYLAERAPYAPAPPVIMITGRSDPASRARAERLGALAFLDKPVDSDLLVARIHQALAAP